ncbi:HAUS augmin-like complex subunit 6 N-terminus-domain-containing protein [Colletotrichum cereale]|nr:HAUS augmin-like complex subunit 6 N-terminus-domain-containing protein [Colletotrichum cereale]
MATLPPNSLLARSRQTRSGPNTKSSAAPIAPSIASSPVSTTHVSLFLTNLRLLDFPSYPDWPDFDAHTFSVQKKRIHCVEWTLYQLFVLWDPEEARNKLQPFFPPRDHVQSLNLRAALLRSLDQAKKNGVLGRDAVVRKTMLDECKGERLEEVLAVFSSAVLKKIVAQVSEAEGEYPAVAQQLALENRGYSAERTELITLALAHRASIANAMRRKDDARKQYNGLAELLNLKEAGITRRREEIKAASELSKGRDVSDDLKLDTWRAVRNNWAGNEQWMETLLYGDSNARKDGLLSAPFDRVWRRLQSGRLSELEDHGKGLLEQLDGRVRTQRERLAQWQHFQVKMFGDRRNLPTNPAPQPKSTKRGINLAFDLHESLHLGQMSSRKQLAKKSPPLTREYTSLLDDCEAELTQVSSAPLINLSEMLGPRSRQLEKPDVNAGARESLGEETVSELSELEDDLQGINTGLRRLSLHDDAPRPGRSPGRPALTLSHETRRPIAITPSSLSPPLLPPDSQTELSIPPPTPPLPEEEEVAEKLPSRLPSPSPPERERKDFTVTFEGEDSSPEPPKSPTQELADQILNDIDNASPSPMKRSKPRHTLSLAERTRLSMARSSRSVRYDPDDEEEDNTLSLQPSLASINRQMEDITINVTDEDDLVSRTRKSMAGFEAARQKAQLDRQRSLKKSKTRPRTDSQIPVVEEETLQVDPDASILAEELMTAEDMEAVFRSRPRIKTSPAPSPSRKPLKEAL